MVELLKYDQIIYNEPILHVEQELWKRKLTDHEKNLLIIGFRYAMTKKEIEELKILDVK